MSTICSLFLEDFNHVTAAPSALVDDNWCCRKCSKLAADHPHRPLAQQPNALRKVQQKDTVEATAILVQRMVLAAKRGRPQRILSYVTKSHAYQNSIVKGRVSVGVPFFFDLVDLNDKNFRTDAFGSPGPAITEKENPVHHPYFLRELAKLVASASAAGVPIRQRAYLSRAGQWLSLDDGISAGVEPDFCTTDAFPVDADTVLVPDETSAVSPPASKYDVDLTLEAKKCFMETDQMEAIDYSERLLCIQRGRSAAYGALFHCCGDEKVIRWVKTWEADGQFKTEVSTPAQLGPGLQGSNELLTMLTKSREQLGRPFPSRIVSIFTGVSVTLQSFVGEGATSQVFVASRGESSGVVKILKSGFEARATQEVRVLQNLVQQGVTRNILLGELVTRSTIYFPKVLKPVEFVSRSMAADIVSLLEQTHAAGVIHRDVRPDNIMVDESGLVVYLIDWGCAWAISESSHPPFEGTFRFASDAALDAAMASTPRAPEKEDDLESVVRSVLAINSPSVLAGLGKIEDGEFGTAKQFWEGKNNHHHFKALCEAAQQLNYEYLKQQIVI